MCASTAPASARPASRWARLSGAVRSCPACSPADPRAARCDAISSVALGRSSRRGACPAPWLGDRILPGPRRQVVNDQRLAALSAIPRSLLPTLLLCHPPRAPNPSWIWPRRLLSTASLSCDQGADDVPRSEEVPRANGMDCTAGLRRHHFTGAVMATLTAEQLVVLPYGLPAMAASALAALPEVKERGIEAIVMPFVARDEEAFEIAKHNIANAYYARVEGLEKPTLVSSSQLFGAGKTAMGKNAVACVRDSQQLRERLEAQLLKKLDPYGADKTTVRQLVEDYANAVTVRIDLQLDHPVPPGSTLGAFLALTLHWVLGQRPELKDKGAWAKLTNPHVRFTTLVAEFHRQTGRNVFIHIDEVAALLHQTYDDYFLDLSGGVATRELQEVLRLHRLWEVTQSLLHQPNGYLFITGKSAGFSLIGLQRYHEFGLVSPTDYHHLLLGALSRRDIAQLYERLQVCSLPLKYYVRASTPDLQELLFQRLERETVGLPRLVQYYFEALCRLESGPYVLRSPADIDAAIARAREICITSDRLRPSLVTPAGASPDLVPALQELLEAALFDRPLPEKDMIALAVGQPMEVVALVNRLGLYAVRHGADEAAASSTKGALLRLLLPPVTAHYLLSSDSLHLSPRVRALLSLSDEPIEKLDHVVLERAVRVRLAVSLRDVTAVHAKSTWAEALPVLAGTWAAQERIQLPDARRDEDMWQALPRMLAARGPPLSATEPVNWAALAANEWAIALGKTDWAELLLQPKFRPVVGKILYFRVQSHSPDVVVFASEKLAIAFQVKYAVDGLAVGELQEELNKTAYIIGKVPLADIAAAKAAAGQRAKALSQAKAILSNQPATPRKCADAKASAATLEKAARCDLYLKLEPGTDGWFMLPGPHTHERVVLVLASWRLGADLQNSMGGKDAMLLDAGMWSEQLKSTTDQRECKVDVPEGMQVVVLGRIGMAQLLGSAAQLVLDKIMEAKNDPVQSLRSSLELYRGAALGRPVLFFNLESFLRDEAKIDEDGVKDYLPLLKKNKVDEAGLRVLATEPKRDIEARLEKWGVSADNDRLKLANAIVTRFGARKM